MIEKTLNFANQLTGELIVLTSRMTELSGGQTRALLIADATVICNTPIVLLDEVENAGINRSRAMELLRQYQKIFIFCDPRSTDCFASRLPNRNEGWGYNQRRLHK